MFTIFEAIFPVFSLIIIGSIFRRINFPGNSFWPLAEKLTYYALFPALLVTTLATANIGTLSVGQIFWPIACVTLLIAAVLLLFANISAWMRHLLHRCFRAVFGQIHI